MGLLENAIAKISPSWAYKRECFKQGLMELRSSYDAASHEKTSRNWSVFNDSAENLDKFERDTVRARARDLERNSDIMNSVTSAWKRNVVGGGYRVQAKTASPELNQQIEKLWKKWCKKRNCDVTGTQSLNQMIRMAVERKKIDGGILFVKAYTSEGVVPFQLQAIEVDEIYSEAVRPKRKQNRVVNGIEYNKYNKPQGYYIKQYSIDGMESTEPRYVPAEDVIFYFSKRRPSQIREMSDMAPTVTRIRDANEFMDAVSVKERVNACLSVFIKRAIPTTGIGRNGNIDTTRTSYEGKTLTPGMIKELNQGDEIQVVNPSGQATDATTFTKQQIRLIGSGQGLSYEAISRDMSQSNYSSARQGWIEDDLTYAEEKELLIEVLDEIYETFVISASLAGKISISPAELLGANKDIYLSHEWTQEPKAWIDPYKESNANMVALRTGQKTFKTIAAENGRDWKDQLDDMAEVAEYGNQIGVDVNSIIYGIKSSIGGENDAENTGNDGEG